MVCCLAVAGLSNAQTVERTTSMFTAGSDDASTGETSTVTVPDGVNTISIIAIGGGGGGGAVCPGFSGSGIRGCAGGGGGAYVKVENYPVTPGDVLTIHVGSRGSGHQSCSSTYRGWGGDSWVKLNSTVIVRAKGASDVADGAVNEPGIGGQATACTAPTGSVVLSGGNGGKGSTGTWCGAGGGGAAGGGNGGNGEDGNIIHQYPGAGATHNSALLYAGNGGNGTYSSELQTNDGDDGGNYGGGGGGGATDIGWIQANGGDGGPGYVRITYSATCNATPGSISAQTWVCNSTDTAIVISNTALGANPTGGSYVWQHSTNGTTWSPLSGNVENYTAHATGYYRRGYVVGTCDPVFTSAVYVTRPSDINPGTIEDGDHETEKAICAGTSVNITLSKTYSGNVQWQTSPDKLTWTDASTGATYSIIGTPTATTYVRYIVKYTSTCDIPSNNVYTLTVKPLPVVKINGENPYNVSKCADASIDVTLTGAASYEWENHSTANPATFGPSTAAGSYVVTGTTNGCSSTATVTFTILPVPTITATPANQSITYGQYITDVVITNTASTVSLSPATLPGGLTYSSSTISGKPTAQGSYTITATANSTYGCTPATQEIKINVGKKNLTVTYTGTDGDNTKVYDGYPLTLSYDKLTFTGLESTDHITSGVITTDGYKVGDYICNAGSFERMWATGTATPSGFGPASVTQNYTVTFNVTLSITKRSLEITANSASKEYDATPLTPPAPGYSFTNGTSLATTDAAEIAVEGSQLCPGSSNSTVTTVVITHTDDNVDVTDCYNITKKTGTLTVTPMACPATKTFEGYDYPLVQVGNKCWFAENLRAAATDAVPYDNQSANTAKFGLLYNWSAALAGNGAIKTDPCNGEFVQGICPSGWAIPSAADFNELQTIASGVINLRSDDATYWLPEYLGTDAVNFDERGGGLFNASLNRFEELKTAAYFWTSESVLHAASFPDGVAHTYCDEYYCGEYIPKTISVNSKSSIRCVRKTKED